MLDDGWWLMANILASFLSGLDEEACLSIQSPSLLSDSCCREEHLWAPQWSQDQIYQRIRVWICFCFWSTCTEPCAVRGRNNTGAADGGDEDRKYTCELFANFNQFQSGAKVLSARLHLACNSTDRLSTFPWETDG